MPMLRHVCAALLIVALSSASADAQESVRWEACSKPRSDKQLKWQCARITVPLDHSAPSSDRGVRLSLMRLPGSGPGPRPAVIALAGGPGGSAIGSRESWADRTRATRGRYDLVVLDQRGTGRSERLRCRPDRLSAQNVARCAERLGPRRRFFTTAQSVADLDWIRRSMNVRRIVPWGVSYGTFVALEYARRHPESVERLVLDSPFGPGLVDPLFRDIMRASPRVLRDVCAAGACRAITEDVVADLRAVASALERKSRSVVAEFGGRRTRLRFTAGDLLFLVYRSGSDIEVRRRLPALLRAAAEGDLLPLARFRAAGVFDAAAKGEDPRLGSYLAYTCQDSSFPWASADPRPLRIAKLQAFVTARPLAEFASFGPRTALQRGAGFCAGWPEAGERPDPGALPEVPALILAGVFDVRTSTETARELQAALPGSLLFVDPDAGHDVHSAGTACARDAVAAYFAAKPLPGCKPSPPPSLAPRIPRRLRDIRATSPVREAVRLTFDSVVERDRLAPFLDKAGARVGFSGLRGGTAVHRLARGPTGNDRFVLARFRYFEDVAVSGRFSATSFLKSVPSGRLTFTGAVRGTLRVRDSIARGVLNGSRYRIPLPVGQDG